MKSALFLDRDGVINVDHAYVHKVEDFEFIDGIFELCKAAVKKGYLVFVVTNQTGIGRGYYTEADFQTLTHWMCDRFLDHGVEITEVFHCPYHPTEALGGFRRESFDRKPNPGMILKALQKYSVDATSSVLIGDKESDIQAARAAGIGTTVLYAPAGSINVSSDADCTIRALREALLLLF